MSSCLVDESTLVRIPKRYAMHDAAELDDATKLAELLRLEAERKDSDADYSDPVVPGMEFTPLDKNERDNHGCTPLHVAAQYASIHCFKLLVSAGAKVNLKCNGSPLLHILISMYAIPANIPFVVEAVTVLLGVGTIDVLLSDDTQRSWLHVCAAVGAADIASLILAKTPEVLAEPLIKSCDKQGRTALHIAATNKHGSMVEWILAQPHGRKLLHEADAVGNLPAHSAGKVGWSQGLERWLMPTGGEASIASAKNWAGLTPKQELDAVLAGPVANTSKKTLILTHPQCAQHRTCEPINRRTEGVPPENTARLDTLLNLKNGTLRHADILSSSSLEYSAPQCSVGDVMRVHAYPYVRRLLTSIGHLTEEDEKEGMVTHLDGDTAVSKGSWDAALHAAGAVCAAIDRVIAGEAKNAFCPVRPPGHHAGPLGVVTCENDKDGSHGFCLLNNVLVGAAYARANYGRPRGSYGLASRANVGGSSSSSSSSSSASTADKPIRRIAIFDFDVHHGNGSEQIIRGLYPSEVVEVRTTMADGATHAHSTMVYRPWLDEEDGNDVMFVSSHGYGKRDPASTSPFVGWFYPGSGAAEGFNAFALQELQKQVGVTTMAAAGAGASSSSSSSSGMQVDGEGDSSSSSSKKKGKKAASGSEGSDGEPASSEGESYEDGEGEFDDDDDDVTESTDEGSGEFDHCLPPLNQHGQRSKISLQTRPVPEPLLEKRLGHPHIINFACPHDQSVKQWRRLLTLDILPRIAAFKPDLILVSAGFDAHHKDSINCGYVGLREDDYEWVTQQLMKIANTTANGRIVSVLEGGYRIQGRIVSAFGRSVAAHVRALSSGYSATWDSERERAMVVAEMTAEKAEADAAAAARASSSAAAAAAMELADAGAAGAGTGTNMLLSPSATANSGTGRTVSASGAVTAEASAMSSGGVPAPISTTSHGALSGVAETPGTTTNASSSSAAAASGRSKRRREPVNYAELDAKLKAEKEGQPSSSSGVEAVTVAADEQATATSVGEDRPAKAMKTEEGQSVGEAAAARK